MRVILSLLSLSILISSYDKVIINYSYSNIQEHPLNLSEIQKDFVNSEKDSTHISKTKYDNITQQIQQNSSQDSNKNNI